MSERILRKTTTHELIERTFTTEPKPKPRTTINIGRKGSIVKERCRQLTEMALTLYPSRKIDRDDLTYLITSSIGGDRATIRAYMGYNGYVKHSHTGSLSVVIGKKRRGYLETFGYMHKANLNTWVIHAQTTLPLESNDPSGIRLPNLNETTLGNDIAESSKVISDTNKVVSDADKVKVTNGVSNFSNSAEAESSKQCPVHLNCTLADPPASPLSHNNEGVEGFGSKENFSLSHSLGHAINTGRLSDHRGRGDSEWETINVINNNNNSERERNFTPMISPKIQRIQPNGIHNRIQTEVLEHLDNLTDINVREKKVT